MKTVKLYYKNCHLREFSARVLTCEPAQNGFLVTLDATAFYPEGGGQACDLGTLGQAHVMDVQEQGETVVHLCDCALEVGSVVEGKLDWSRRFDLMQQHSGEHIVSGLVHKIFGHHNVGFHVGSDRMEIDFDGPIPADRLPELETLANEAVWANLPINCWYPSQAELPTVFYRTKKALPWPVRIVEIPGYDSCACCGVHVSKTGEIGLIKILSCVKFHQGVRMELACGARALQLLQAVYEQNKLVSQAFSAKILETGAAANQINEALAAEKFRANGLQNQLFDGIAGSYAGKNQVLHFADGLEPSQVRTLADKIAGTVRGWCAVFSGSDGNFSFCLATREGDLRQMCNEMNAALNGRGGGKPNFQQGSVKTTRGNIEAFFAER